MYCKSRGFTLVELVMTMAILMIVLAAAIPSLDELKRRNAASAAHNMLSTGFAAARSHAVTTGALTTICPVAPEGGCRSDGVWDAGWWIFIDTNGNNHLDPSEVVVRHQNQIPTGVRIRSGRGRPRATFRADGTSSGTNLSLRICTDSAVQSGLILSNAGRVRVATAAERAAMAPCL